MKKHYILNRPMFNRGGVSAYGKGIASNLVTEEQRQRFNYGGRVRAASGFPNVRQMYFDPAALPGYSSVKRTMPIPGVPNTDYLVSRGYISDVEKPVEDMSMDELIDYQKGEKGDVYQTGSILEKPLKPTIWEDLDDEEKRKIRVQQMETAKGAGEMTSSRTANEVTTPIVEKAKVIEANDRGDVMTDSDWMDLLGPTEEQKRRTKGETQLNLAAAALDVFSQPTIAKGMKAASPHLSKLAQTASADQKARDKAILQGKVLEKVYKTKAGEAGKWALKKAYADAGLTGNIETKYNTLIKTMSPDKAIKRLLRAPTNDKLIKGEEGKGEIDFIKFEKMAPGSWTKDETAGIWYVVNKNGKAQPIGKVTDLLVAIEAATK